MKKWMLLPSLLLFLSALAFSACEGGGSTTPPPPVKKSPFDMITRSWRMHKMTVKSPTEMASPAALGNSSFTFYKDGHYEIVLGDYDKGTWQFGPFNKTLVTTSEVTGQAGEIDIEYLSDTLLIMYNNQSETPVRMELKPE